MTARDLATVLAREAPLDAARVIDVVSRLLDALQPLHEAGQAHGALQPAIVVVDDEDVVLGRWSTTTMGSDLPWLAPERTRGAAPDVRSDLWSVGAMAYALATGRPPFEGRGNALGAAIRSAALSPVRDVAPWVSPELAFVIERALVKDPNGRWPTAESFARALRAASPHEHVVITPPPESRGSPHARTSIAPLPSRPEAHAAVVIPTPPTARARRRPGATATRLLVSLAAFFVVLCVGLFWGGPKQRPTGQLPSDEAPAPATPIPGFAPRPIVTTEEPSPMPRPKTTPTPQPKPKPKMKPTPSTSTSTSKTKPKNKPSIGGAS